MRERTRPVTGQKQDAGRYYYCRSCGKEVRGERPPTGWYNVARHTGRTDEPLLRLGLFCSVACMTAQMPRLKRIEENLGDGWLIARFPNTAIETRVE